MKTITNLKVIDIAKASKALKVKAEDFENATFAIIEQNGKVTGLEVYEATKFQYQPKMVIGTKSVAIEKALALFEKI
ncbi:hypothetical protein EcWhh1_199 [Escherichia phage EcWhh-1]|nr:hypothetical protein EcWhh1_199 [Escherichia phage EcWhh-1]